MPISTLKCFGSSHHTAFDFGTALFKYSIMSCWPYGGPTKSNAFSISSGEWFPGKPATRDLFHDLPLGRPAMVIRHRFNSIQEGCSTSTILIRCIVSGTNCCLVSMRGGCLYRPSRFGCDATKSLCSRLQFLLSTITTDSNGRQSRQSTTCL